MKSTDYYKSGKQLEALKMAVSKSILVAAENKKKRINDYNKNPTKCLICDEPLPYEKKGGKFCSRSCSAKHSNRVRDPKSRVAQRESLMSTLTDPTYESKRKPRRPKPKLLTKVSMIHCPHCGKDKWVKFSDRYKKTCGNRDCIIQACVGVRTYKNGRRKLFWYFNPCIGEEVLLESSWELELAKFLDSNNIDWIRPKFIKWIDDTGVLRRYFPDFYLPKLDLYLDPKNPYCMVNDRRKMEIISSMVQILYGDLNYIKKTISDRC